MAPINELNNASEATPRTTVKSCIEFSHSLDSKRTYATLQMEVEFLMPSYSWTCRVCDHSNSADTEKCSACDADAELSGLQIGMLKAGQSNLRGFFGRVLEDDELLRLGIFVAITNVADLRSSDSSNLLQFRSA